MAEKRVIEYEAASELANDDWLLIDGVTEGTRKARPNVVTAELGAQVTNLASTVGGLTQVAMGHEQSFAPSYDESESYDVGDLVMQYHDLYRCTAPTTGTWDAGKWARTEVSEQLEESGKIDDVQVNGVSVVTDKVASIDLTDMQADIDSKQADTKIGGESILDNNKVANLDFLASYGEASGSIASFNDGAAMPLKSLKVGIEAVQSGTGDPSPTNVRPFSGWSAVNRYRNNATDDTLKNMIANVTRGTYGFVDLGSLTWYHSSQNRSISNAIANIIKKPTTQSSLANLLTSNGYMQVPSNTSLSTNGQFVITQSGEMIFYYDGVNEPKGYMVFELATPTTPSITAEQYSAIMTAFNLNGTTYTTTLKDEQGNPLTCYGGTLSNVNGGQSLDNKYGYVEFDGSSDENWVVQGAAGFYIEVSDKKVGMGNYIANNYKATNSSGWDINTPVANFSGHPTLTRLYFRYPYDGFDADLTAWRTWLASNNVTVVYELATPQTIPQDNLAIATQEGTNNLWADSGDILECKYVRDNSAVINDLIARVTALENA